MASISQVVSVHLLLLHFAVVLPVTGKKILVFPLSGETYCGGHISFSTNISTLIKLFSMVEVSDCKWDARVRDEASLCSVMWQVIGPIKPLPCSAEVLQGREVLPKSLKWHRRSAGWGNSSRWHWAIIVTTSSLLNHHPTVEGSLRLCCHGPFTSAAAAVGSPY